MVRKRGLEREEGRKKRMECLFQMGSYYIVLVGPEPTHVCKSVWPQVCDNLNLLAECWDDSPVQFGKVGKCPEFII